MAATMLESSDKFKAITPHATSRLEHGKCRSILVGGAGTIVAYDRDGDATTITAVAGQEVHIRTDRVLNTSTATGLVALY